MNAGSALDGNPGTAPAALPWMRRVLGGWTWGAVRGASRRDRLQLDPARLAAAGVSTVLLAAGIGAVWTWHCNRRDAEASAQAALAFVDRRLGAIDLELARISRSFAELPTPLTTCPDALAALLTEQSLQSGLVRRFDLVQVGTRLRCEPLGERQGKPLDEAPPPGLSIVPGSQIAAKPVVLRPLAGAAVLQATLDPYALALPRAELPTALQTVPLRIVVQSPPAGALPIWDSRPEPGRTPPAILLSATSGRYAASVTAQVDQGDLMADVRRNAAAAVVASLLLLLGAVGWYWQRTLQRARLRSRLQRALRKRQFLPFVQPIVDLASGRCVGGEVLMRWDHPQRGIVAPGEFIEEAERSGLILGMSDLTMSLAAHQLTPLARTEPHLYFSFNITPGQLREPGFVQRLNQIFGPDTLRREQVMLELTERDFVDPVAQRVLAALRADGWRIAIDDFGTGQSSLASIESLAVDRIKIDRAFVNTIGEQTARRPVLDAIIGMAGELGVPLIAEGIETRSQWDYLAARGVASAQGYLMARPMAVVDYLQWFAQRDAAPGGASARTLPGAVAGDASQPSGYEAQRDLCQRMASAGGLALRDRRHRLRRYPNCFVGSQAVDWIVRERGVSRAEALRLGQSLLANGLVRHVANEHDFRDGEYFYRLVPPPDEEAPTITPAAANLGQALLGDLGFPWRDHRRGLLRHRQCACGRTVVDWVAHRYGVSRSLATQWAAQLMRQGTLRHVFDDRPFRDDQTLYRLG